jgi:formylmethanofuran dehydrogenase subunit E
MTQNYPTDLQKSIEFHGHFCPGLAIGYQAAKLALAKLQVNRADDEELIAIAETDACGIDAIQSVLGCTIGKGNLIVKDYGKQVYTIASRSKNLAVRIAMKTGVVSASPEQEKLRDAIFSGQASPEQESAFHTQQQSRIDQLLTMDPEKLFKVTMVDLPLPQPAKIFKSVICEYCGEKTMEPRARLKDGKIACLACCEEYTRGW